ncbi:MAG: hypothetical protein ACI8UG_001807 [Gammaproteobacteria bacterium]
MFIVNLYSVQGKIRMAKVTLNCDAFMHKSANEGRCAKFRSISSRKRLKKGSVFETHADYAGVPGMTRVSLVSWPGSQPPPGGWGPNDIGFIRTAKLSSNSSDIRQQFQLSQPSVNGIGGGVGQQGRSAEDILWHEIACNMGYWNAINDVLDLCMSRETNAIKWGPRVKALGALQVLGGATMLGLSIAAIVVTAGAASPLVVAFGYAAISTTAIGIGSAASQGKLMSGTGLADDTGSGNMMGLKGGTKQTAVAAVVTVAKKPAINAAVLKGGGGAATQGLVNTTAGAFGGALAMKAGYGAIKMGNKINPVAAWAAVDWKEIMQALANDYIKISDQKESYAGGLEPEKCAALHQPHAIITPAMEQLDTLIGKIAHAIMESKNWQKGNVGVTDINSRSHLNNSPWNS